MPEVTLWLLHFEHVSTGTVWLDSHQFPDFLVPKTCRSAGNWWESSQTVPVLTCSKCKSHNVTSGTDRNPVQIEIHAETAGVPLVHETAATQGEGSWGTRHQEVSGRDSGGDTALLNTENGDLPGQNSQNHPESKSQAIEAAEDLAADAFNVFLDVATDPAKMKVFKRAVSPPESRPETS